MSPNYHKKDFLNTRDFQNKRYRDDINMDTPYNRKKGKKKNNQSNTRNFETQTHTPSEKLKIIKIMKRMI